MPPKEMPISVLATGKFSYISIELVFMKYYFNYFSEVWTTANAAAVAVVTDFATCVNKPV